MQKFQIQTELSLTCSVIEHDGIAEHALQS